tara:strand:+ start:997 stop:1728 length:732 start_codon:yes stop_codon:yes gene_type:complete
MVKKFFLFIDNNIFIYNATNFLLGLMFYNLIAEHVDTNSWLTVCIAISGAAWSYLAIEHNEVKEIRAEHLNELKDIKSSLHDYVESSIKVYGSMIDLNLKGREMVRRSIETNQSNEEFGREKLSLLSSKAVGFFYTKRSVEKSGIKKDEFRLLEIRFRRYAWYVNHLIRRFMRDGQVFWLTQKEIIVRRDYLYEEMIKVFSVTGTGFEDISDKYNLKKIISLSLVSSAVYSVVIKAVAENFLI